MKLNKTIYSIIAILALSITSTIAQEIVQHKDLTPNVKIKYWKTPEISHKKFIENNLNEEVYRDWNNDQDTAIRFFSNVQDEYGVGHISYFMHNMCFKNNNLREKKDNGLSCLVLNTLGREFKIRKINSLYEGLFDKIPHIYSFDDKFILIFIDLTDKYYGSNPTEKLIDQIKQIPVMMGSLVASTDVFLDKIFVIGNFGINGKTLKSIIEKDLDVHIIDEYDFLQKTSGNKIAISQSQNILSSKNNKNIKSIKIKDPLPNEYKGKTKQETLQYFQTNISNYYPLEIIISK